jgi:uncharacterized protein (TIGR03083 family)
MRQTEEERRDLSDLLASLREDQWDAPTLCEGWRVREVVAHMTMPYRMSAPRFLTEMVRARGRFNTMADRSARRDTARLTSADLLASLRDNITHPWKPPGGGEVGALSHDVIHGLDVTVGLGLDRQVPLDRLTLVLDAMTTKNVTYFGVDLAGVALEATDLDWRMGDGTPVRGRAQDLLLLVCGRRLPAGLLDGAAAGRFTAPRPAAGRREPS